MIDVSFITFELEFEVLYHCSDYIYDMYLALYALIW